MIQDLVYIIDIFLNNWSGGGLRVQPLLSFSTCLEDGCGRSTGWQTKVFNVNLGFKDAEWTTMSKN